MTLWSLSGPPGGTGCVCILLNKTESEKEFKHQTSVCPYVWLLYIISAVFIWVLVCQRIQRLQKRMVRKGWTNYKAHSLGLKILCKLFNSASAESQMLDPGKTTWVDGVQTSVTTLWASMCIRPHNSGIYSTVSWQIKSSG